MLAILVLAACAFVAAWLDPAEPPLQGAARVSDGDSFHLGESSIRLLGLDAPEWDQTCSTAAGRPWPCGQVARERMAELLASAPLTCLPDGHDRYGRILASCSAGEADLAAVMVSEGLAIADGLYAAQERAARNARKGIWQGDFVRPSDWRKDERSNQFVPTWLEWLL